jgi:putative heme transporter
VNWLSQARRRARTRITLASERGGGPPQFDADAALEPADRIVMIDAVPTVDDGIPGGVRLAGGWAWRIVLFIAAAYPRRSSRRRTNPRPHPTRHRTDR